MSSILKALRKLEEEKSRNREGMPDIARDILKKKKAPRRKISFRMLSASVAVMVLAFGVTGYLLFSPPQSETPPGLIEMPPANVHAPAEKTPVNSEITPSSWGEIPTEFKPLPGLSSREAPTENFSRPSLPAAKKIPRKPARTAPSSKPAARETADPLPSLVLTGIAYHKKGEGRLAVINNLPVMEGTMIAGARVEEIGEDRVRFDFSGRSFEVLLDDPAAR